MERGCYFLWALPPELPASRPRTSRGTRNPKNRGTMSRAKRRSTIFPKRTSPTRAAARATRRGPRVRAARQCGRQGPNSFRTGPGRRHRRTSRAAGSSGTRDSRWPSSSSPRAGSSRRPTDRSCIRPTSSRPSPARRPSCGYCGRQCSSAWPSRPSRPLAALDAGLGRCAAFVPCVPVGASGLRIARGPSRSPTRIRSGGRSACPARGRSSGRCGA